MTADTEQRVLEALREGKSIREVAAECHVSRSAAHRIATAHGIVNGTARVIKRERKAGTVGQRDAGQERDSVPASQPPASDRSTRSIDDRLEECTKAASNGVVAADKCLRRGMDILATAGRDSPLLHAAAALIDKGANALARVNGILRLNAGLPDSYAKSESKTEGTMVHEHRNADEALASAERILGCALDRASAGAVPVPDPIPPGPQPS